MNEIEIHIYKVISDYPLSCFDVGQEIEVSSNSGMAYICWTEQISYKDDIRDYPHLFEFVRVKQDLSNQQNKES